MRERERIENRETTKKPDNREAAIKLMCETRRRMALKTNMGDTMMDIERDCIKRDISEDRERETTRKTDNRQAGRKAVDETSGRMALK